MVQDPAALMALAWEELAQSKHPGDPDRQMAIRRQAAEKAWVFVTNSADAILGVGLRGPEAHQDRWKRLLALEDEAILGAYARIRKVLHGECFYLGNCPREEVDHTMRLAAEFPQRLRDAVGRRR